MTETETRTPLWRMTDEQLRFIAQDELAEWDRRKTATAILHQRGSDNETEFSVKTSEVDQ